MGLEERMIHMKIEKLPSGSYRIRKMYKGQMYTVVFDEKPTQKEALQAISEKLDSVPPASTIPTTFQSACDEFFRIKGNVLSPSTKNGYMSIFRNLSDEFKSLRLSDIKQTDIQKEINDYSVSRSPKTTANANGFILSVMETFRPDAVFHITLPQKEKKEPYIPTSGEVKLILEKATGTKYYIPLLLACCGLRRSEILALELSDLSDDNILTINKAMVVGSDKQWYIKSTKTTNSSRKIIIPEFVADMIRAQGYIYKGSANQIYENLQKYQNELGIQNFKLHALRHYFATMMSQTMSEEDVMKMGGWSTPHVMKAVYRHSTIDRDKEKQKNAMNGLFKNLS